MISLILVNALKDACEMQSKKKKKFIKKLVNEVMILTFIILTFFSKISV